MPCDGSSASRRQRQAPRHPAVRRCRGQEHLRHHASLELRWCAPVRPRADLDPLPPHPGRARGPRGRAGPRGGLRVHAVARITVPLGRLGGAGRTQATRATGRQYGGLFQDAPALFDVILMNPPFGGKEGKEAQTRFPYKTGATQVLFLQHVIDTLKRGGRCGIVLDEGVLFRTNETAFVQTKRKLLDDCDLWCIVSLPGGVFTAAGAGVKTNLLFFTKGKPTEKIWYYDLSDIKVGKRTPFLIEKFEAFFRLLPSRGDSERSWTVTRKAIEENGYDLKAMNPHAKSTEDTRTPDELLDLIEAKGREVAEALAA